MSEKEMSLGNFVAHKIYSIYSSYSAGQSAGKATLSNLRRAAGKKTDQNPLAWQYVLTPEDEAKFPSSYQGQGDQPTYAENAAFIALTLYGMHQQSLAPNMHSKERSFGKAAGELVKRRTPSIKKRFDALLSARSASAISYHARNLVQLLHQEQIAFDYGRFAEDLNRLQNPKYRATVITRWSRDFVYGYSFSTTTDSNPTAE